MAGEFEDLQFKVSVDASGVEDGLNKVNAAIDKTSQELAKVGTGSNFGGGIQSESEQATEGLDKVTESAKKADDSLSKLSSANLQSIGSQLDNLSSKMITWGAGLTVIAAPFEAAAAVGISAFADFEKKMNEVFTLMPGISKQAMDEMSRQAREFATNTGEEIGNVTKGLYNAISAQVPRENVFEFLTVSEQAALGGVTDINTAVNTLTGAVNAYKDQGLTAQKASDDMLTTIRMGKTTFEELGNSIGDVTPIADSLGVSFDEVSASIATSTLITGDTSKTMTGLKAMMSSLANPTVGLGKAFSEIAGKDFQTFIKEGGTLGDALKMIRDYADSNGISINQMAGSVEAASGVLQLTGANYQTYIDNLKEMENSQGATAQAAERMQTSVSFYLNKLKAQMADVGLSIGEKLAPAIGEVTKFLSENMGRISEFAGNVASAAVPALESVFDVLERGMDAFNNMDPDTRALIARVLGIGIGAAAIGGPTMIAAGAVLSPISGLVSLLGQLKGVTIPATIGEEIGGIGAAAGGATPLVGGLFAALSNPAVIVVASAALAAYTTNLGGFRDNVNQVIADVVAIVQDVSSGDYEDAGKNMAKAIADGFETLGDLIIRGLPEASEILKELQDGFKDGAKEAAEGFTKELINNLKTLASDVEKIGDEGAKAFINGFNGGLSFDGVISTIQDNLSNIDLTSAGENAIQSMSLGMYDIISSIFSGIGEAMIDEIKKGFLQMVPGATQEMVDSLYAGIPVLGDLWAGAGKTTPTTTTYTAKPISTASLQYVPSSQVTTTSSPSFIATPVASTITQASIAKTDSSAASAISDIKSAAIAILAKEKDVTIEGATKMYESTEKVRTKYNDLAQQAQDAKQETSGLTSATKGAKEKMKSYSDAATALADDTLAAGAHFKVGEQEYVKTLDKSSKTAHYVAEEQGAAAELRRAQTEIDTKRQDALTKQQEEASNKVTAAQQKYADAIDDAAFQYQQAVKYATSPDQISSAEITYKKALDKITYDAGKEGVSLDGLNTSMQVNTDTVNNLKSTYTKANEDLKNQLRDLEAERQRKLASATAGKTVDTSAIDKKIAEINKEIKDNEAAISSATSTVTKNTNTQKSSMGVLSASTEALRNKYIELSKVDPSIAAQMSREDLLRNIALYGEQIGDVNDQLGGSVDQLQQVAIEVSNIGATDAFSQIQNKFQDLKAQFESGAISQDQYLDGLRKASAETDTLSRSTNILKGSQKDTVLEFERNIKESLRRIEAGTYGAQPISAIGESITRLGGSTSGAAASRTISSIDKLDDAYVKQGVSAGKAAALQLVLNDALSDGNVKLSEAYSYLGAYNQVTGQNAEITQESARETLDMMNALQQANQLQSMYKDAMADGSISAQELTGIQGQQQAVQDALTQASQNALGPTGELPGSLQAVADTVSSVLEQISNALSTAQAAASQAQSAASQAQSAVSAALSAASQVSSSAGNTVNISNNQFGQTTTVADVARSAFMSISSI